MENKIDVTLSMLIDSAVLEYEKTTNEIMGRYGISIDLAEIALEKSLIRLKDKKLSLYASAMCDMSAIQMTSNGEEMKNLEKGD